jgi:hypothetical protein
MKKKRKAAKASLSAKRGRNRARSGIGVKRQTRRVAGTRQSKPLVEKSRVDESAAYERIFEAGVMDGERWRLSQPEHSAAPELAQAVIQRNWSRMNAGAIRSEDIARKFDIRRGKVYSEGFMEGASLSARFLPVPLSGTASAVLCATRPEHLTERVIAELNALPLKEVVFVLCRPDSSLLRLAKECRKAVIAYMPEVSNFEIGRALGTKLTDADIVLFVDGEQPADAELLARFLMSCDGKADMVLNETTSQLGLFNRRGGLHRLHEFLNVSLNRPDLKSNTIASLPFALSRKAIRTLGVQALAVPVKAHAMGILTGLKIVTGGMAKTNPDKERTASRLGDRVAAGDHAEAWHEAIAVRGERLKLVDLFRNRVVLGGKDW